MRTITAARMMIIAAIIPPSIMYGSVLSAAQSAVTVFGPSIVIPAEMAFAFVEPAHPWKKHFAPQGSHETGFELLDCL